jgi:Spy/CpxP family protein refolding chaperone
MSSRNGPKGLSIEPETDVTQTMTLTTGARQRVRLMMLGMLMAVLASLALTSWAQPMPGGPMGGDGGGWMHRHHEGEMHEGGMGGFMMGRGLDRMLDGLNATEQQRTQIRQIAQAAANDLRAQRQASRDLRQRAMQVFTAPTVDPAAAESVRQQMMAQHDQASRRVTQAMLDVARVLTPEQRAKIGERMRERQAIMKDRSERMEREHERMMQGRPMAPAGSQPRQ